MLDPPAFEVSSREATVPVSTSEPTPTAGRAPAHRARRRGVAAAVLILAAALAAAPPAGATDPGGFFESVKTYQGHTATFQNGYAAGLFDAVSMFTAATGAPLGLPRGAAVSLFRCLDSHGTRLDGFTIWMIGAVAGAAATTPMAAAVSRACGASYTTEEYFEGVSDMRSANVDFQQGFAAGYYDSVSQFADASESGPLNSARTADAFACLKNQEHNLGELRSWVTGTLPAGSSTTAQVGATAMAACHASIGDLTAAAVPPVTPPVFIPPQPVKPTPPTWLRYLIVPLVMAVAAAIYSASRRRATPNARAAGAAVPPGGPQPEHREPVVKPIRGPDLPPDEHGQPDNAEADVWDTPVEAPAAPTGLWLWVPGRPPLAVTASGRLAGRDFGAPDQAAGANDLAAVVEPDPDAPQRFRLRNRSERTWRARQPGGDWVEVAPAGTAPLVPGLTMMVGEVRVNVHPWNVAPQRPVWQPSLRLGDRTVTVAGDLEFHEYELPGLKARGGDGVVARVTLRSSDDPVLGLQNVSTVSWVATPPDGGPKEIEPGRTVRLRPGMRIACGTTVIAVD